MSLNLVGQSKFFPGINENSSKLGIFILIKRQIFHSNNLIIATFFYSTNSPYNMSDDKTCD